jgi:hypothetical protein
MFHFKTRPLKKLGALPHEEMKETFRRQKSIL